MNYHKNNRSQFLKELSNLNIILRTREGNPVVINYIYTLFKTKEESCKPCLSVNQVSGI